MVSLKQGRRILNLVIIAFAAVLFASAGALTAVDVPDQIKIENEGYKKDIKGSVTLSHKKHSADYNVACTECHHLYGEEIKIDNPKGRDATLVKEAFRGTGIEMEFHTIPNLWKEGDKVQKCIECHDPLKKDGNAPKLQTAYHNNCRVCHKELGKKNLPGRYVTNVMRKSDNYMQSL
ncbi:MAG: cytochrome c3 family protein [Deltaproteobacteria bacterium]|nr:cytochrome c3 family protein [Deltaproteobacteria bacterium]